jgi:hypothetical protein
MTNAAKIEANDRREEQFAAAEWKCCVCGGWLREGVPQLAHRVLNSKHNRATIDEAVLHSTLNTIPVCSLDCNGLLILHGPEADALLARIERVISGEESVDLRAYYSELREQFYRKRFTVYR